MFENQLKIVKMGKEHTDLDMLKKGLKRLVFALPLLVLTTYVFTFTFLNKEVLPLWVGLILGISLMAVTIWLLFKGIGLVLKSIF